jgi:hypothetical protein
MFCSCDYWYYCRRGVSEQFEPLHTRIHSSENDRVFVSSPFLLTNPSDLKIHSESVSVLGLIDTPPCFLMLNDFDSMVDDIILESLLHPRFNQQLLWVQWIDSKSVRISAPFKQCFDIIDVGGLFFFWVFWHLYWILEYPFRGSISTESVSRLLISFSILLNLLRIMKK